MNPGDHSHMPLVVKVETLSWFYSRFVFLSFKVNYAGIIHEFEVLPNCVSVTLLTSTLQLHIHTICGGLASNIYLMVT